MLSKPIFIILLSYYFNLSDILAISIRFLIVKMVFETTWHASSIVERQLYIFTVDILDKLIVKLSIVFWLLNEAYCDSFHLNEHSIQMFCVEKEKAEISHT